MTLETLVNISRLFIPVVAIAGIAIAWQQFTANRDKLRLDLYDRRFRLYDTIKKSMYESIYGEDDLSHVEYSKFLTACNESQFLLPNKVYEQVEVVKNAMMDLRRMQLKMKRFNKSEKDESAYNKLANEMPDLEQKIEELHPSLTNAFRDVLKFEKF